MARLLKTFGDGSCCSCENQSTACDCGGFFWTLQWRANYQYTGYTDWSSDVNLMPGTGYLPDGSYIEVEIRWVYDFSLPYTSIEFTWQVARYEGETETIEDFSESDPGLTVFPIGALESGVSYYMLAGYYATLT